MVITRKFATASVYRRRDLCLCNPSAPPSLGRHGPRGARPVPWRRSDPRWLAQRDHGGHARRPTRPRLAVAGADGGRSRRLVQLGPSRQLGSSQRYAHPPGVASDQGRRHACRPCPTGASGGKSQRWSRSISWVCACQLDLRGRPFDPNGTRPRYYTDSLWAFLLEELPGNQHAAGGQRLLGIPAALAAADHERALPGSAALDHANAAIREPEAPRRAHRPGHDDPDAVCRAGRRERRHALIDQSPAIVPDQARTGVPRC